MWVQQPSSSEQIANGDGSVTTIFTPGPVVWVAEPIDPTDAPDIYSGPAGVPNQPPVVLLPDLPPPSVPVPIPNITPPSPQQVPVPPAIGLAALGAATSQLGSSIVQALGGVFGTNPIVPPDATQGGPTPGGETPPPPKANSPAGIPMLVWIVVVGALVVLAARAHG